MEEFLPLVSDHLFQAGYTALHLAASRGHLEIVRALLVTSRSVNNQDKIVCSFFIVFMSQREFIPLMTTYLGYRVSVSVFGFPANCSSTAPKLDRLDSHIGILLKVGG